MSMPAPQMRFELPPRRRPSAGKCIMYALLRRLTRVAFTVVIAIFAICVCSVRCPAVRATDPQSLFNRAVKAQERGNDAAAVRLYRELLALHPEAVLVRVNLGATLAHLKLFKEASTQYRIALTSDPTNRLARMNLAIALEQSGEVRKAIDELEELHRTDSQDEQSLMMLADCYVRSGRPSDAISILMPVELGQNENADFERVLGEALSQVGRTQEGVERVETAAQRGRSADAWLLAGHTRFQLSQFDLAERDVSSGLALDPNLPGLMTLKGMIQEQLADYERAEETLLKASERDPRDFDANYYLGAIYYFKREMKKAGTRLILALQLQPNSTQARFELALVERATGHAGSALQDLLRVTSASPDWLQPHVELSSLYYLLHQDEEGEKERQTVDRLMAKDQQSKALTAR